MDTQLDSRPAEFRVICPDATAAQRQCLPARDAKRASNDPPINRNADDGDNMTLMVAVCTTWLAGSMALFGDGVAVGAAIEPTAAPSPIVHSVSYLSYHPDLNYQIQGQAAFEDGNHGKALWLFRKSAAYGDKGSQAMIAEMHWMGLGTPKDRALAYVWMDLASSRGSRKLTLLREHYWLQMSAEERLRALDIGPSVFVEFADAITMGRMQDKLRSFERHRRMSRAMSAGVSEHHVVMVGGGNMKVASIGGKDDPHWDPERYLEWRDAFFENPGGATVDVGELVTLPAK